MESSELFHDQEDPRASLVSLVTERPHFPLVTWEHQISHLWSFTYTGSHHQLPTHIHHFSHHQLPAHIHFLIHSFGSEGSCFWGQVMSICCALTKCLLNSVKYIPSCSNPVLCLWLPALGDQGLWVLNTGLSESSTGSDILTGTRMKKWVKCDASLDVCEAWWRLGWTVT